MFTGIIETLGQIVSISKSGTNVNFSVSSPITSELRIDQSVAHNGVCLTIVQIDIAKNTHVVTAIDETLNKTNLGTWKVGQKVNLERCLKMGGRLDGHIVQGHVDTTATCKSIDNQEGSYIFTYNLEEDHQGLIVPKGSITINGVSLTVVKVDSKTFSVAIIPYTFEHTHFGSSIVGDKVNVEFDILGKYIQTQLKNQFLPS